MVLQRNKTKRIYTYIPVSVYISISIYLSIERLIYVKECDHVIMEAGKSEICRAGQQDGNSGKS